MGQMRASGRASLPDLGLVLTEANKALLEAGLPSCAEVKPVADGDTANPTLIAKGAERLYVVKVVQPRADLPPQSLSDQCRIANEVRQRSDLPIPQHLCSVEEPGRLPLIVMEWMPGQQVRLVLPRLSRQQSDALCEDWGRCMARLHAPDLVDVAALRHDPAGFAQYWLTRAASVFDSQGQSEWHLRRRADVVGFLRKRLPYMTRFVAEGLLKKDSDVRDFLAMVAPKPHISGILDWERVWHGDGAFGLVCIWLRLHLLGIGEAWDAFRQGYEMASGRAILDNRQTEFYLVARATVATPHYQLAREIVDGALCGKVSVFERPDS